MPLVPCSVATQSTAAAPRDRGRGPDVGPQQRRPDDGGRQHLGHGLAGVRVEDVRAARRDPGRRHTAVGQRHGGQDARPVPRVLDPDPPRVRVGAGPDQDVAARPDRRGRTVHVIERPGCASDRPGLDQAGRVEDPWPPGHGVPGVEPPVRADQGDLAQPVHLADGRVGGGQVELTALDPADLRVVPVGAEHRLGGPQIGEQGGHGVLGLGPPGARTAQVHADRHPHDLLDPRPVLRLGRGLGRRRGRRCVVHPGRHHSPAWSRASCRDWTYPRLVTDAPLTMEIWAEPAAVASSFRIGIA